VHNLNLQEYSDSNLVGLVVELLVVLGHLWLLRVVPGRKGLIKLALLSPLFTVNEPCKMLVLLPLS
jgi:hypothetical protein